MMDVELIQDTVDRIFDRNKDEFESLARSHGMGFAASVLTTAMARTLGLVLAMGKTKETQTATMAGFLMVTDKSREDFSASIEMLKAVDKAKGIDRED